MSHPTDATALVVFVALFAAVTVLGFIAARWRRGNLAELTEWGLGGKRFGSVVTWFLLGGDLYTAYTFIAVPALVFGVGAVGFFALPYTILIYPLAFLGAEGWTTKLVITVALTQWFIKTVWEALLTPVTYAIVGFLKRREGVDVFDTDTDFSPFRIGKAGATGH